MKRILVFFEGKDDLREGFSKLLRRALPESAGRIRTIAGGDKDRTKKRFLQAREMHKDCKVLLLVDSDEPRAGGAKESYEHFMVQVMEAWFLTDRAALRSFYGDGFRESALPGNPRVEDIAKKDVLESLHQASRHTAKGGYHKIQHAVDLLGRIDPQKLRQAAPHGDHLIRTLESWLGE